MKIPALTVCGFLKNIRLKAPRNSNYIRIYRLYKIYSGNPALLRKLLPIKEIPITFPYIVG